MNKVMYYRGGLAGPALVGEDDKFSILVFDNGDIEYKEHIFGSDSIKRKILYKINIEAINEIKEIFNKSKFLTIPNRLHNGSCDGGFSKMIYYSHGSEHSVLGWNIQEIKKLDAVNKEYLQKYKENIEYENEFMRIFKKIQKVFKSYGYNLNEYDFCRK